MSNPNDMVDCATCDGRGIDPEHDSCKCDDATPCPDCPDCDGSGNEVSDE